MNDTMAPRERFLGVLNRVETDRIPVYDTPNHPDLIEKELGTDNYYSDGPPFVRLSRKLGLDACLVADRYYSGLITRNRDWKGVSLFEDETGTEYTVNESTWPLGIPTRPGIVDRESWERIELPDPRESRRYHPLREAVTEAHRGKEDDIAVIGGVRGAFSTLTIAMGLTDLSLTLYDDPSFLEEMIARLTEYWSEVSVRMIEEGADAVFIAEDMGINTGTMVAPDTLRRFFIPALKRQVEAVHTAGGKVIFHSCGNIEDILSDIVSAGIDCYNNVQKNAGMDIGKVKRNFGERIVLMGNVDATNVMTSKEPHRIVDAVIETIRTASPGGGHILATDHSFHKGIPVENIYTFIEAAHRYGKYPLDLP
jgi:uroporphyrinogen decarboxylase